MIRKIEPVLVHGEVALAVASMWESGSQVDDIDLCGNSTSTVTFGPNDPGLASQAQRCVPKQDNSILGSANCEG